MTRQTSIRFTEATDRQIAELQSAGFGTVADIIRISIDRMHQQEKNTMQAKTLKIRESIRREIAQAIVTQSDPSYDTRYHGERFAVDTDGDGELDAVYFRESQAQWNPWHDNAVAVSVADIYAGSDCTFDPTPEDELIDDNLEPDADPAYDEALQAAEDLAYMECPTEIEID